VTVRPIAAVVLALAACTDAGRPPTTPDAASPGASAAASKPVAAEPLPPGPFEIGKFEGNGASDAIITFRKSLAALHKQNPGPTRFRIDAKIIKLDTASSGPDTTVNCTLKLLVVRINPGDVAAVSEKDATVETKYVAPDIARRDCLEAVGTYSMETLQTILTKKRWK
jgi:hypothetical protein